MKIAVVVLALASSAAAFAPASHSARSTALNGAIDDLPGCTKPVGPFDPLNLATLGSEDTLVWFRASELKHSRVAMLATTGYLVQAAGWHFPGMLSHDVSFESLSTMKPLDAWNAVPALGQAQIVGTIFLAEVITEAKKPHYLKGGAFPEIVFPPVKFAAGMDAETLKTRQSQELNNGRLAMIAIMSFISAAAIPGSVPALVGIPMF